MIKVILYFRLHTRSKHLGVRYPCPHCDYKATSGSYIKVHIQENIHLILKKLI